MTTNDVASNTVIVFSKTIAGIPVLEVVAQAQQATRLPLMIGYHGWTNVKESQLGEAMVFARAGYRVLLPDAYLHGDRKPTDYKHQNFPDLYNAIQASVLELPELVREARDIGILFSTVNIFGRSMGGMTVSIMTTKYYDKLSGVAHFIGTPDPSATFETFLQGHNAKLGAAIAEFDDERVENVREFLASGNLSKQVAVIADLPYFAYHGVKDEWVSVQYNRDFAANVKEKLPSAPFKYLEFANEDHWVPFEAVHAAVEFLDTYKV